MVNNQEELLNIRIMRKIGSFTLAMLFVAPALANSGEQVHVRALDAFSGEVLAEKTLDIEERMELDGAPEHMRYLALRRGQFRGREVLEISLSAAPDDWDTASYTAWNEPSANTFRNVRLETVPHGWADRYCRELSGFDSISRRDPSVSLVIDGSSHLSEPGWRGEGQIDLVRVAAPDADPQWQARIDGEGKLHVREGSLGTWRAIDSVRDDFFMVRQVVLPAGRVQVTHDPGTYARRFCERYEDQGTRYVETIVDHIFGRRGEEDNGG